ncbi:phytoene desaturase family protein [Brevibacterium yomogidense]|uniref:Phytoene dehydrogenase n=1 Tax=Brevibacterium yomogidense TaxID=946573 RepID=A0A1X6WTN4_9MICO|nr:phytoene desaturase family protein [Brevibacterium yomogidense]SLM88446.1 Phytoene dehydrogenase [Brevibacterium yomogidense]
MSRVIVIGAGISGLATAALAAQDGHDVTVLERLSQVGGRAATLEDDGFLFDTGPSWYLMPEVFDAFFRRFGTTAEQELDLVDLTPSYRLFPGHVHPSAAAETSSTADPASGDPGLPEPFDLPEPLDIIPDRAALHALFERLEPGSSKALDDHLASASLLYDLALEHALRTDFGREHRGAAGMPRRVRSLGRLGAGVLAGAGRDPQARAALPQLPGLLTGSFRDHIHSRFRHPLLRQILLYPTVFLASDPGRTPALYHLMSRMDLIDGVKYPMGGMGTLIDAFTRLALDAGVRITTDAEVLSLRPGPGSSRAITEVVYRTADGLQSIEPDWVVAACDLHHVETRMLPPKLVSVSKREWEKRDPGMGALTVMLGIEGRVPGLSHHTLFFTDDWETNFASVFGGRDARLPEPASTYVCAPTVTDPSVAPEGCESLFLLVPFPANPTLKAGQDEIERYVDRVIDAVGARVGAPDLRSRVRVRHVRAPGDFALNLRAWSGTALGPAHTLKQSAMFRDSVVSPQVSNLLRAGAYTAPGVGLPMCVMSAENAFDALRSLEGRRESEGDRGAEGRGDS